MARIKSSVSRKKSSNSTIIGKRHSKTFFKNTDLHQRTLEMDLAEDDDEQLLTDVNTNSENYIQSRIEQIVGVNLPDNITDDNDEFHFDDNDNESHDGDTTADFNFEQLDEEEERAYNMFLRKPALSSIGTDMRTEFNSNYKHQKENITEFFKDIKSQELPPLVVETYKNVGLIMRRYRSGTIPKAFKIVPILERWLEIFSLMEPEKWTAAAVFQATKYFISSAKPCVCEKFINLLLLPRVRDDILEFKKLNYHIQNAIRMSTRKPASFFKGFLIPLCQEGTCTLREAVLIGGILRKCKIPVLHVSVVILKIASMNYSGANSLFLQIFLRKNYALPYKVLDILVDHFVKFLNDDRKLTVLWHQCLLIFIQEYGKFLAEEQKQLLSDLCNVQKHPQITPEVVRAIQTSYL